MAQHELKQSGIAEIKLTLTDDQQIAFDALRVKLDERGPPYSLLTDSAAYRFLYHHSNNVDNAADAIVAYLKWREDNHIDNYVDPTPDKTKLIRQLAPYTYHGYDKQGRPVYYEKTGKIQSWAMSMLISEQEFINSHIVGLETISKRCQESSQKLGKQIDTFTCIFDLNGLGLGVRSALYFLKACAEFDGKYYPAKSAKIIVLNAPWCVNILYPLIQVFLHQTVQQRIEVVYGDIPETLLKLIDADQIPAEYGGTCVCEGGCVQEMDCTEILQKLVNNDLNDGLTRENVAAGAIVTKELSCGPEGGVFSWFFESEGQYDIDFEIKLTDADKKEVSVKPKSRIITNKGSYTSNCAAKLVFEWDNSYSYFNSKDIKYCVDLSPLVDLPSAK